MGNVNIYVVNNEEYDKTFCKIIETVVAKDNNRVLLTVEKNKIPVMDKLLWSFAQLSFIPHATMYDEHANEQVVYITDNPVANDNNANVVMSNDAEMLLSNLKSFKKGVLILSAEHSFNNIIDIFKTKEVEYSLIKQQENGAWKKVAV